MLFSDPARECAEAISTGLNVLYRLAHSSREPDADTNAERIEALEGLAAALERAREPDIETDHRASPEQVAAVRSLANGLKTGQRPENVASEADALYAALTA